MKALALLLLVGMPVFGAVQGGTGTPQAVPLYVDVTAEAGIDFHHVSGPVDHKDYIFETKGGGVGFFDYDKDGWLDILLVQGSTVERALSGEKATPALYHNRGDGTFEDVTGRAGLTGGVWGMGVTFGDYDNDGDDDIYLTQLGPDLLYRNNGDGTFTDVTAEAGIHADGWSTSAAFGDYDGDGLLDLYVAGYLDYGPSHLPPRNPSCTYLGVPVLCGPRGLQGARDYLYRNRGGGVFEEVSRAVGAEDRNRYFGLGVLWSDLDGDGDLDLFVGNDATPNYLFENQGDGTFQEIGFISGLAVSGDGNEQASMGVDSADYDNDGRLDLFLTHFANDYSTLYHNDGGLMFMDVSGRAGLKDPEWNLVAWGTRFLDVDNDGWKDILHSNGHVYPYLAHSDKPEKFRQPCSLYQNLRDGTFADASQKAGPDFMQPEVGRGVAFGDYDNDGDLDLIIANLNGSPRLLRADRRDSNHWIMFRLEAKGGTRDAIGSRLRIECSGLTQIWEIKRAVGIYSASDPRAHFGLGECDAVEHLQVRWPDGTTQAFEKVPADRHYLLRQGGELEPEPFRPEPEGKASDTASAKNPEESPRPRRTL